MFISKTETDVIHISTLKDTYDADTDAMQCDTIHPDCDAVWSDFDSIQHTKYDAICNSMWFKFFGSESDRRTC